MNTATGVEKTSFDLGCPLFRKALIYGYTKTLQPITKANLFF